MNMLPFFRRAPRPQTECWEVGDLAECVVRTPWFRNGKRSTHPGPVRGERYVVEHVSERHETYLGFARFAPRIYAARAFRKVRPQPDAPIAADAIFTIGLMLQPEDLR